MSCLFAARLFVSLMALPAGKWVLFPRRFDPLVAGEAARLGREGPPGTYQKGKEQDQGYGNPADHFGRSF
jgi:hypothetical protein